MVDFNALARQIQESAAKDPQARAALDSLMQHAQSPDGKRIARSIPPACAGQIEQAAAAAQRGDMNAAKAALSQMMHTPEGADLARQLQFLMGK